MSSPPRCVLVCQYRSCTRNGAAEVLAAFQSAAPAGVHVSGSDCMGQCASGVTVRVIPEGTWYCRIRSAQVAAIVEQHLQGNQPVTALLHPRFHPVEISPASEQSVETSNLEIPNLEIPN